MNIEEIRADLSPVLNEHFDWHIDFVDNQGHSMLFINNYTNDCGSNKPLVSFALCLSGYDNGVFPSRCWMTNKDIKKINNDGPRPFSDYGEIFQNGKIYYPFSVNLSEFIPINGTTIKHIVERLYAHIDES